MGNNNTSSLKYKDFITPEIHEFKICASQQITANIPNELLSIILEYSSLNSRLALSYTSKGFYVLVNKNYNMLLFYVIQEIATYYNLWAQYQIKKCDIENIIQNHIASVSFHVYFTIGHFKFFKIVEHTSYPVDLVCRVRGTRDPFNDFSSSFLSKDLINIYRTKPNCTRCLLNVFNKKYEALAHYFKHSGLVKNFKASWLLDENYGFYDAYYSMCKYIGSLMREKGAPKQFGKVFFGFENSPHNALYKSEFYDTIK